MSDQESFAQLAEQTMDTIYRLAFSCLKNPADADDVTQTVLLRLYETRKVFESDSHRKNWLIRVTLNECKKHWRSPWRRTEDLDAYTDTLAFQDDRYRDLLRAVMELESKYRVVIYLHYYEGYSIREMAGLLKLPPGTVGTRLARGRSRLRDYLSEEESL